MRRLCTVVVIGLTLCGCHRQLPPMAVAAPSADVAVYTNGMVFVGRDGFKSMGFRVEGGRITDVFKGEPAAELSGRRVNLRGAWVLPGLVDAHFHLRSLGRSARLVNLKGTRSLPEAIARVRQAVTAAPPGTWVRGRGWDQNDWPVVAFPTAADLDAVSSEHPVWLDRIDGHAVWVNSKAMELAGITAAIQAPTGGEILRGNDGQPVGVFVDTATDLLERFLPEDNAADIREDLQAALTLCRKAGLTGVHDMGTTLPVLAELRGLEERGELTLRVTSYVLGSEEEVERLVAEPPDRDGLVRVVGVKLAVDGALGSRGAALLEPYSDRSDTRGLLRYSSDELGKQVKKIHNAGYQVAIHAIGDRGVRTALDAIEQGQGEDRSRRHRIEHVQVVAPSDWERMRNLGVVASMQPTHATSDMPWAEQRLGPLRIRGAYAWRTVLNHGIPLAFGSDAPIEEENPWLGIQAAVLRRDLKGHPREGWYPQERLSLQEALLAFTQGSAHAASDDGAGALVSGARADLTIVVGASAEAELKDVEVLETMVGGRTVYPAKGPSSGSSE